MSLAVHVSLLLVRVVVGIIFMSHGYPKLLDAKATTANAKFFKSLRIPAPRFFTYLVGFIEFFGGLAVFIGFWTPLWAFLLSMVMVVAIALTGAERGFKGGYELDLLLFVLGLMLFIAGGGMFSISSVINY